MITEMDRETMSEVRRETAFEVSKRLGQRIRELRKLLSLTQEELAERANISASFLSMIERDDRVPHIGTLAALADALGVSLSEMFAGVNERAKGRSTTLLPLIQYLEQLLSLDTDDVEELLVTAKAMFKSRT